ncbi:MAG: hypothetical protein ACKVHF_03280, partial [Candidatus Poseidoniales archaeon]
MIALRTSMGHAVGRRLALKLTRPSILFMCAIISISSVRAASSDASWVAPDMPEWSVPLAIIILIAVYTLIVFEIVHRALAAAVGGIAAVISLHVIGEGPDLSTIMTWIDW